MSIIQRQGFTQNDAVLFSNFEQNRFVRTLNLFQKKWDVFGNHYQEIVELWEDKIIKGVGQYSQEYLAIEKIF